MTVVLSNRCLQVERSGARPATGRELRHRPGDEGQAEQRGTGVGDDTESWSSKGRSARRGLDAGRRRG